MQYKSAESKNIQKVNSVEDCNCIKIVILKIDVVARLAREDLLGPICQRCMKQKLHLFPPLPLNEITEKVSWGGNYYKTCTKLTSRTISVKQN